VSSNSVYTLRRGSAPLLVSVPHAGTLIPEEIASVLVESALAVEDTDWHLDSLYAFAHEMGASMLVPRYSRYVIDLNRSPENEPMYPGANNTELCPTRSFAGESIYLPAKAPDEASVRERRERFWRPYHEALAGELDRIRARHGYALLWDGHSIKSVLPWLFDGKLPDLNLGTAGGKSCAPSLRAALSTALRGQSVFSHVTDGRFKGGYITRHYGQPGAGVHVVQLEMCWSCYMDESPPYTLDRARAAKLEPVLQSLLRVALDWRPND